MSGDETLKDAPSLRPDERPESIRSLDLTIGTPVFGGDQRAGTLARLVIDPLRQVVTHLVVTTAGLLPHDVVVPIGHVQSLNLDRIALDLDPGALRRLPPYREFDYAAPEPSYHARHPHPPDTLRLSLEPIGPVTEATRAGQVVRHVRTGIPDEAVVIHRGMPVACPSGPVGVVDHVLIDPRAHALTHFVVREGVLLTKDVAVPIHWAAEIDDGAILLAVGPTELERLPRYERHRRPDSELEAEARQALGDQLGSGPIAVHADQGEVTLRGRVETSAERIAASDVVRSVPGALSTRNLLVVGEGTSLDSAVGTDYGWLRGFLSRAVGLRLDEPAARVIVAIAERKLRSLAEVAEETALANGRQVILVHDVPLTRGLRTTLQEFNQVAREVDGPLVESFLRDVGIVGRFDPAVRALLPRLYGTLLILVTRVVGLVGPHCLTERDRLESLILPDPATPTHGELDRACGILDLVL